MENSPIKLTASARIARQGDGDHQNNGHHRKTDEVPPPAPPSGEYALPPSSPAPNSKDHRSHRYRRKRQDSASSPTAESPRTPTNRSVIRSRSSSSVAATSPRISLRGGHHDPPAAPQRHRSSSPPTDRRDKHRHHSRKRGSTKDKKNSKPPRTDSSSSRTTSRSRSCSRDPKQVRRSSSKHASANSTRSGRTHSGTGSTGTKVSGERGVARGGSFQMPRVSKTKPTGDSPSSRRMRRSQSMGRSGDAREGSTREERRSCGDRSQPRSRSASRRSRSRRSNKSSCSTSTTPTSSQSRKTSRRSKVSETTSTETQPAAPTATLGGDVVARGLLSKKSREWIIVGVDDDASCASSIDSGACDQLERPATSLRENLADDTEIRPASRMSLSTPNMGYDFFAETGGSSSGKTETTPKPGKGSQMEQVPFHQTLDTEFDISFGSDFFTRSTPGPHSAETKALVHAWRTTAAMQKPQEALPAQHRPPSSPAFPQPPLDSQEQPKPRPSLGNLLASIPNKKVAAPSLASLPEPSLASLPHERSSSRHETESPILPAKKSFGASMNFVTTPSFFRNSSSFLAKRLGKSLSHVVSEPSICSLKSELSSLAPPYKPSVKQAPTEDFAKTLQDFTSEGKKPPNTGVESLSSGQMLSSCDSSSVDDTTREFLQFSLNTGGVVPLVRPDDNLVGSLHKASARTPPPRTRKEAIISEKFDTLPPDFVTPFRPRRQMAAVKGSGGPTSTAQRLKEGIPPPGV